VLVLDDEQTDESESEHNDSGGGFSITGIPDCGSGAGGDARDYELPNNDLDNPAATNPEQNRILDHTASSIKEHRARGHVPEGLSQWANDYLEPTIDWRHQLAITLRRSIASVAGRRDYSYMRPSRRQDAMRLAGSTVLLPAMRQPAPPRIAIVADTSGSISSLELNAYLGELKGIIRAVGISQGITIIPCDAVAYEPIRLRSSANLDSIDFVGGGGTNMCAGIHAALELKPAPHIVVVLTDGLTPWPENQPMADVHFIVATTIADTLGDVPPWMTAVVVESV